MHPTSCCPETGVSSVFQFGNICLQICEENMSGFNNKDLLLLLLLLFPENLVWSDQCLRLVLALSTQNKYKFLATYFCMCQKEFIEHAFLFFYQQKYFPNLLYS